MAAPRLLFACLLASSCASSTNPGTDAPPGFVFATPRLDTVTPGEIALGDKFRVFGADFLDPDYGSMRLHFDGTYTDELGETHKYVGDLPLDVKSAGIAEAELDHLYFLASGDRTGTFQGKASVIAKLEAFDDPAGQGSERTSEVIGSQVVVLPSIDIMSLHSVDRAGCEQVTKATNGNNNLTMQLRTIGVGVASSAKPFTFRIGFSTPQANVRYVANGVYSTWPLPLNNTVAVQAPAGLNTMEIPVTSGNAVTLDPKTMQTQVKITPAVTIGQQVVDHVILERLATGAPPDTEPSTNTMFVIEALTYTGQSVHRVINLNVWKEWEVKPYDGNQVLKERYNAEQVYGCVPGGDTGRRLAYDEGTSLSKSRSMSARWDASTANSLGVNVSISPSTMFGFGVNYQATFTQSFGMDVSESVSSESHMGLNLSADIPPTYFGVCYRQLERLERSVNVVFHNACGASGVVGQAVLTDWSFGFDIATGPTCPPPTNLPPAETFD